MNLALCIEYCRPTDSWNLNGETLEGLEWFGPSPPPTQEEIDQAWQEIQAIKTWSNVQKFMAEFTMQEKASIALSADPTIAALRLELTTWFSQVLSNDPRVVAGLDKLVELGIISAQRKQEIIAIN